MQYFETGEFEKAAGIFKTLYEQDSRSNFYFDKYIESLLALEQYALCEKIIKNRIKKEPENITLYVTQGKILEEQFKDEEALKIYQEAIKKLPSDRLEVIKLGNEFIKGNKFDLAIQTYERGAKLLKDEIIFSYNLGDLYRRKGDTENMIRYFLNALETEQARTDNVKLILQRYLEGEDWTELQKQLYERLQRYQENILYTELLTWVFIQKKDFKNALRQMRALDRRLEEDGRRVFELGAMSANAQDYDVAIEAFDYIVDQKGRSSSLYLDAKKEALYTRRKKLTEGFAHSQEELKKLEEQYLTFLLEYGRNKNTAQIVFDLASLEALYINDLDRAIELLEEMILYPGVNRYILANAKIHLADYYLMQGERWEATLLYSQVDKEYKDDLLGQIARFKNAKLSYFAGDFQWAQSQFDVLKASTSKLIANDALDLSVFIMDNLGLDTTSRPLELFAEAELLIFQNRFEEVEDKFRQLENKFSDHNLRDDVLFARAGMLEKQLKFAEAAATYEQIIDRFPDEIRADNSIFALARLYENKLGDPEKAKELYEKLFIEYSGSTFAVDARKRFRILRGDFNESQNEPGSALPQ